MKMKLNLIGALLLISVIFLSACGGGSGLPKRNEASSSTGWLYNDADMGGFEVVEYTDQPTGPGLTLIEGGTFTMGNVEQDVMYDWNSVRRRVTVSSYYMDQTEIRNLDYREYLHWITKVFADMPDVYRRAVPDTQVWRRRLEYNEPYVEYYFRHPAYHDYPVVGVSWLQATEYCIWRSDRVNELLLIDAKVLNPDPNQSGQENFNTEAYLAGQYEGIVRKKIQTMDGGERNVRMEDGILLPRYRLPTEAEWEYAALALIGNSADSPERIYAQKIYPWNGHYLRNDEKQNRGLFRANFQRGRGDLMGVAGYLNDNAAPTSPVTAYWPNDFGLYCMSGNVSEWVLDVYRPASSQDVGDFNPFRGNIFTTLETKTDGSMADKDSLGRMKTRLVTEEECLGRVNYQKADNINYLDGDLRSGVGPSWDGKDTESSTKMYNSVGTGENGVGMTSLVTDKVRIYKGGGWRDRAYWMVPGTRRFLDQGKSTDDIGFRCAMIRVGSPGGFK